jgi:hypothetical protein
MGNFLTMYKKLKHTLICDIHNGKGKVAIGPGVMNQSLFTSQLFEDTLFMFPSHMNK